METINYKGHDYYYEYRLAKGRELCLATKDPQEYCNGWFAYSSKDPGSGMEFVIVDTTNTEVQELLNSAQ
jgi:hypothetical protein